MPTFPPTHLPIALVISVLESVITYYYLKTPTCYDVRPGTNPDCFRLSRINVMRTAKPRQLCKLHSCLQ